MNVLHVSPAFYPATYWGGPIFSVYGLCNALAGIAGCQVRVLTTDTAGPRLLDRVQVTDIPKRYPAGYDVYFARRVLGKEISPGLLWRLWPMIRWADVVHLTGTYSFPTIPTLLVCKLLGKPLVWSPCGGVLFAHEWDEVRRPRLKKLWEHVCNALMPRNSVLHVTSEVEKTASLARLPRALARVIPIGVEVPETLPSRTWLPKGVLRLLFIGRLDPMKGIENLLAALGRLRGSNTHLDIFGSGDPRYAAKLTELMYSLGLAGQVSFMGHVEGEAKRKAFLDADVCVVPSHIESFGIVVAEALAHGVPVIASTGTPWAEVEKNKCGWWVKNAPESLADTLLDIRTKNLAEMGNNGRVWMQRAFQWSKIADEMFDVYLDLARNKA